MPVGEKQHHKGLVVSVGFQIFFQLPPAGPWCPRCPRALWLTDTAGTWALCCFGEVQLLLLAQEKAGIPHQPRHLALQPAVWQDKMIRSPDYLQSQLLKAPAQPSIVWLLQKPVQAKAGNIPHR